MFRLLAVRASIAALKRAITISDKFSPGAWKVLAACQCALFVFSIWGFQNARERDASQYSPWSEGIVTPSTASVRSHSYAPTPSPGKAKNSVWKAKRDAQTLSNQLADTSGMNTSGASAA